MLHNFLIRNKRSYFEKLIFYVFNIFKLCYYILFKKLDVIFISESHFRQKIGCFYYHKFYEKLIKKYTTKSLIIEFNPAGNKIPCNRFLSQTVIGNFLYHINGLYPTSLVSNLELKVGITNTEPNFFELFFQWIFERSQPRKVFTVCHYNPINQAVYRACSKLNITAIEFQHGNVVDYYPYRFSQLCDLNPSYFPGEIWVWNRESKAYLDDEIKRSILKKRMRVRISGNPWIVYCGKHELIKNQVDDYALITLSSNNEELPPSLVAYLKFLGERRVKLIVRLHPRKLNLKIANHLGLTIQHPDDCPLPYSLKFCRVHFTVNSSSVLDAALLGKTSIVFDQAAFMNYKSTHGRLVKCGFKIQPQTVYQHYFC